MHLHLHSQLAYTEQQPPGTLYIFVHLNHQTALGQVNAQHFYLLLDPFLPLWRRYKPLSEHYRVTTAIRCWDFHPLPENQTCSSLCWHFYDTNFHQRVVRANTKAANLTPERGGGWEELCAGHSLQAHSTALCQGNRTSSMELLLPSIQVQGEASSAACPRY